MGGVHIAADHHVLAAFAGLFSVFQEGIVEVHLVLQAVSGALSVGKVDVEKNKISKVGDDGAAFGIEAVAKSVLHALRCLLGVKTNAAVALFLRG